MQSVTLKKQSLIFLPGLFAGGWIWNDVISALEEDGHQCIKFESAIPIEMNGSMKTAEDSLNNAINQCFTKPIIVGNSMGALIALDYLTTNESRIAGIVMSGSPGLNEINVGVSMSDLKTGDIEKARMLANNVFFDKDKVPEHGIVEISTLFNNKKVFVNIVKWLAFSRKYQVIESLNKVPNAPIRLIWGEKDKITPLLDWTGIIHRFDNVQIDTIKNCGHSPMIEDPASFTALLLDFLQVELSKPQLEYS